ncbi:MAG TPA: hypothetical protein VLX92_06625 [Kofleriaceae bacterium]|nr:hypothetical protein [Kofleriaceae bacterium]
MKYAFVLALAIVACKHPAEDQAAGSAHHEDRQEAPIAPPKLVVDVSIDGAPSTWHSDAFDKVAHHDGTNNGGDTREVWSLRDLVHTLVGPNARVVSVTGRAGTSAITPQAWGDATQVPILHTTRRGTLKFRWTPAQGGTWGKTEVTDVAKLEIVAH